LLIDAQKDFCFPEGSLYVGGRTGRGALDDNRRTAEFIYRNLHRITHITATLDSHFPFQIFFAPFWVDAEGRPLSAHREIGVRELDSGAVRPNPALPGWLGHDEAWLARHVRFYCEQLERKGRYRLYLWPPHCLLGGEGHALAGVLQEARLFHSYVRGVQAWTELKGMHPLTEHYSALGPEVRERHDGGVLAQANRVLLGRLLEADQLIVAGQAASHCVRSTLEDLLDAIRKENPRLAKKVYLLTDCMSAVAIPDGQGGFVADFTLEAQAALERFAAAGMHLVRSTDPMGNWPEPS
jgi:nicotinamidase-related amidase